MRLKEFISETIREYLNEIKNDYLKDIIFYHGSDVLFDNFNRDYATNGNLGSGFYFTPVIGLAKQYGNIIYKVNLDITNPLYINSSDDIFSEKDIIKIVNNIPQNMFKDNKDEYVKYILSINNSRVRNEEFIKNITFIDRRDNNVFERLGYDAIIGNQMDEVVIWNPNKIRILK